ncbi:hypothetical protein C8R44DRAFT_976395 [Mycena epipterygia]|nr:hypothetical protein C8R44DRAFT_976395 [Mycena epipterygia]
MLETIRRLKERVEELEHLIGPDPSRVYLNEPYFPSDQSRRHTPDSIGSSFTPEPASLINMAEPPSYLIAQLVDLCLERFSGSGFFFFDRVQFRRAALLPLPFGNPNRPSPALLSATYLWGSVLAEITPSDPYTPAAFLQCAIQNIPEDLNRMTAAPTLVLETLQAEVLLSLYYLHTAHPVQGQYHCAAAWFIAQGARLNLVGSSREHNAEYPPFPVAMSLIPSAGNGLEQAQRIDAFWAVVLVNNYWVITTGSSSSILSGINVDTPWPSSSQGGATITRFLGGNDTQSSSSLALLAKASILLERIISFYARAVGAPDLTALTSLECRLFAFQASLPPISGGQTLLLTHAFTDLAILRLNAPHTRTSDTARYKAFAAAVRIATAVEGLNLIHAPRDVDPMFALISATVASFWISEMLFLYQTSQGGSYQAQTEYRQLETRVRLLVDAVALLAPYSPIAEHCFLEMRQACANIPR